MSRALVCGAGGFIGQHLVRRLKAENYFVRGVDLHYPHFSDTEADEFLIADLRDSLLCREACAGWFDEIYQLAADMGGAGFIFTGKHDSTIMTNSSLLNLNLLDASATAAIPRAFFPSSACIYPQRNQLNPDHPDCSEDSAYPAFPDSEYGWEKLYAERLFLAYDHASRLSARVARLHNVYGPEGAWEGGREKAPAAICRKVAQIADGGEIEIWGDGHQTRSFLYIDDCVDGIRRLMRSNFTGPVNIGSEERVSILDLVAKVAGIAGKRVTVRSVPGPQGVRGRTSDNRLAAETLGWKPVVPLAFGLRFTFAWIERQVAGATKSSTLIEG